MNRLDAKLEVVSEPVWDEKYQTWRVKVEYSCWGSPGKTEIWKRTKQEADQLKVGDIISV